MPDYQFDPEQFDAALTRFNEMKISGGEAQVVVGFLCAASPTAVLRAFDHVQLLRDPEPRHQPGHAALPSGEQARRQAKWLNARGKDVCPVCLGFRQSGVCPGGHDQGEPASATHASEVDRG
jgi:hypothetical protein